jgi:hypothetical protein
MVVVLVVSIWGLFAQCYKKNWPQAIGMALVAVSSGMLIDLLLAVRYVPPPMVLFALGAACYSVGTAYKVWVHRHHGGAPRTIGSTRPETLWK